MWRNATKNYCCFIQRMIQPVMGNKWRNLLRNKRCAYEINLLNYNTGINLLHNTTPVLEVYYYESLIVCYKLYTQIQILCKVNVVWPNLKILSLYLVWNCWFTKIFVVSFRRTTLNMFQQLLAANWMRRLSFC